MLAYMVRTLIVRNLDKQIKSRTFLYKRFLDYVISDYYHERIELTENGQSNMREALQEISYKALVNSEPMIQSIPLKFCQKIARKYRIAIDDFLKYGLVQLIVDRTEGIDKYICFSHQSFQEYLATEWVCLHEEQVDYLEPKILT